LARKQDHELWWYSQSGVENCPSTFSYLFLVTASANLISSRKLLSMATCSTVRLLRLLNISTTLLTQTPEGVYLADIVSKSAGYCCANVYAPCSPQP
jgi:hypothetical protein